jgi:hypothetical protein
MTFHFDAEKNSARDGRAAGSSIAQSSATKRLSILAAARMGEARSCRLPSRPGLLATPGTLN